MAIEAYIGIVNNYQTTPLIGYYTVTYELVTPGNKVVYSQDIFINEGTLTFEIVPDGLDTSLFESYILKSQLTLLGNDLSVKNKFNSGNNSFLDSDTIELPYIQFTQYDYVRCISTADKFLNTALMNIDEDTGIYRLALKY